MKRIISIILVLVMLFSISCFADFMYNYNDTIQSYLNEFNYDDYSRTMTNLGPIEKCYFYGKVIQVSEGTAITTLRVNVNNEYGKTIYCELLKVNLSSNILEDDEILIIGTTSGKKTYETIFGASVTIPKIVPMIIELSENNIIIYNTTDYKFDKIEKEEIQNNNENTEGKSIIVPAGFYKVGEDIPAGDYCLTYDTNGKDNCVYFKYGTKINKYGNDFDGYNYDSFSIYDIKYKNYSGETSYVNITLFDGMYVKFERSITFTIGKRKANLGF